MLRTRLWMGSLLIGLAILLLMEGRWFAPYFPILLVCYTTASLLAGRELLALLPAGVRPNRPLTLGAIGAMAIANWLPTVVAVNPWRSVGAIFVAGVIAAFLWEMWRFQGPDSIALRIGLTALALAYLGVLPSFLAQLRWLPDETATWAIALAVFVPKGNDIGAYFTGKFLTGRLLGRTPMSPRLSPKKTWQGFVGGMVVSVAVACGAQSASGVIPGGWIGAVAFGLTVGLAGVLGDLAESLIKRDLETKDASQTVPGFGGVLDVVDSLLFAGVATYAWFAIGLPSH